jgi:hypothetical protein
MHDSEQRIRERAYAIWEQEGRPGGREHVHWERARLVVEMEAGAIETGAQRSDGPVPPGDVGGDANEAASRTRSRPRAKPRVSAPETQPAAKAVAADSKRRAPRPAKVVEPASSSRKNASAASPRRNAGKDEAARAPE